MKFRGGNFNSLTYKWIELGYVNHSKKKQKQKRTVYPITLSLHVGPGITLMHTFYGHLLVI
ncbi:hypothetical protein HanPSC8_Chr07g0270101 [Helianthus annuus]|nr:hypothetical protein HanPSC8_Chr07g0270101 [Helianthus annuus]